VRSQVTKLAAHVETLLDILLDAHARWEMLKPILNDRSVISAWGGGARASALDGIRRSLMHVCVLDIAHITLEPHKNSPSIGKVMIDIENESTLKLLRSDFMAAWAGPKGSTPDYEQRSRDAAQRFERDLTVARDGWSALKTSARLLSFKTFRDKNLAHVELMYDSGRYEHLKVSSLGIKWKDIGQILNEVDPIVLALNSVCRVAGFDLANAREQFAESAKLFWEGRNVVRLFDASQH
jgi:hypothetical protein